ncbi:MAG: hypothetical protein H6Q67_1257 [Firmicutes bacterium]|nr:hypothetical protein [Bacillota bacterium]
MFTITKKKTTYFFLLFGQKTGDQLGVIVAVKLRATLTDVSDYRYVEAEVALG